MASSTTTEKTFHVRSVSLPSRTHPTTLRVEEELLKLKLFVESSLASMSSITNEVICNGLKDLATLYDGIKDLLHQPRIQQGLRLSNQTKALEEGVDGSMRLLDLCGTMKDAVVTSKEHAQDLQLALRRRGDSSTGEKVQAYICSRKETQKTIKKCYKDLKQIDAKSEDSDLPVISRLLNEARMITRSLLCSILQSLVMPKTKASWWPFASKAMRIASKKDLLGIWHADVSLCEALQDADAEKTMMGQNQLKAVEISLGDLENGLEHLFRRLIQNRVSLLNILSL
ncbi:hypothetical protein MUK42_27520 [Musa troglodytarum]|uniref:Uncharacterized protein n=1 Tax=Musa troglodytarum TaxID=320322 RepID=A0A9E7F558_9LILI|nr:hypothetical protein MUK42_27520 [Musa troglodytarum]